MKRIPPLSVCIISALFGFYSLSAGVGSVSIYIQVIHREPLLFQLIYLGLVVILVGSSVWISLGLVKGSRDARVITLALCWLVFFGSFMGGLVRLFEDPLALVGVQLIPLLVCLLIYRTLTRDSIRNGFFRRPGPDSHLPQSVNSTDCGS